MNYDLLRSGFRMTEERYEYCKSRFLDSNKADLEKKLRDRFEEVQDEVKKDRSFREFFNKYMGIPFFVTLIAYFCACRDICSWQLFLTIVLCESMILGLLWIMWREDRKRLAADIFGRYGCPKMVQEVFLMYRHLLLEEAETTDEVIECYEFCSLAMQRLPYEYSEMFIRGKLFK